jgi:energy-coupling factor transport system substrate-specific component
MFERLPSWRARLVLALTVAVGAAAFLWPFVLGSAEALARGQDLPWLFTALLALLAVLVLAELSAGGLTATQVAILAALAAMGGALRVLSAGTAGLEPIFALLVLGGRALGARLAFLLGALALLTGAFLTGGVGPWTPFQMIACGWVALGAAVLPRLGGRAEVVALSAYGLVAGLGYGLVMNLWFWPFLGASAPAGGGFVPGGTVATNVAHYAVFFVATSLGWDLSRGALTAVLVALGGRRTLASLRRALRRASFAAERPVSA